MAALGIRIESSCYFDAMFAPGLERLLHFGYQFERVLGSLAFQVVDVVDDSTIEELSLIHI